MKQKRILQVQATLHDDQQTGRRENIIIIPFLCNLKLVHNQDHWILNRFLAV